MNLTLAIAYFIHLVATIVWIGGANGVNCAA
jgi:uncharacterized membrane protein